MHSMVIVSPTNGANILVIYLADLFVSACILGISGYLLKRNELVVPDANAYPGRRLNFHRHPTDGSTNTPQERTRRAFALRHNIYARPGGTGSLVNDP